MTYDQNITNNKDVEVIYKSRTLPEGRPTNLTPELIEHVIKYAETEHYVVQVARLSRIPYPTLNEWLLKGRDDIVNHRDSIYADLFERYEYAKGLRIKNFLERLESKDSFLSITWLLERCFPEDFGRDSDTYKEIEKFVTKMMKLEVTKEIEKNESQQKIE